MSMKDNIVRIYLENNNKWMSSDEIYDELNNINFSWGVNKRGNVGHKNMVRRDLSSRYTNIFEKNIKAIPNKYRVKKEIIKLYNCEIDEINNIENMEDTKLEGKEREVLIKARINQGKFRKNLIDLDCKCKICGLNIKNLLIASHSKEWKKSNKFEKLDINNGFLLCPNHDSLYDKHLITFDSDGNIIISKVIDLDNRRLLGLDNNIKIDLSSEQRKYVKFHRASFYEKEKKRKNLYLN